MRHVFQEDPMGCFIASVAMVLDMTYQEVAKFIPLQTDVSSGVVAIKKAIELARCRGWSAIDLEEPFAVKLGLRYIRVFHLRHPLYHAVAVDEKGVTYDPDSRSEQQECSEVSPIGVLEFRRA